MIPQQRPEGLQLPGGMDMVARMMVGHEIAERAERMRAGIAKAYGIKAETLQTAVAQVGRRLPKAVRLQAQEVLNAEQVGGHPKLVQRVNFADLAAAEAKVERHLRTIDRSAQRRGAALNWVAQAGYYVFVVFGGVLVWAVISDKL